MTENKSEFFSPDVLYGLLVLLKINVKKGKAFSTFEKIAKESTDIRTIEFLQKIISDLMLKKVQPVQLLWRRFDQRRLPALVTYKDAWHIAERDKKGTIQLSDGTGKSIHCDESELHNATVLWLKTESNQKINETTEKKGNLAAKIVLKALMKEKGWVSSVFIATLIINTMAIATSIFAMQVYDRVVPTLAYATLSTLVVGMLIIISLDWLLKTLRSRILDSAASAVDKRVSQEVYDHVMHLQLDQYPRSLGTLSAQIGGLDSVRQFFSSGVVFALIDMPFAILFIGVIAIIGGAVSSVYLLLFPVAILLGLITQFRLKKLLKKQIMLSNERQGLLVDSIRGAESIRANNASWRFSEDWLKITKTISSYTLRQKAINSFSSVTTGTMSTGAYIGAIVVGVGQIEMGNLTMGGLIACSILGGRVIAPIAQSVQYMAQWQNVAQSLEMVNKVLEVETERDPAKTLLMPEKIPDSINLEKATFTYPNSPVKQLDVANLNFTEGERVLLLGPIGCGKSTLLKVLAGLYKPAEGRIRIGDADLWEIDPQVVAGQISYLPQTVHLFKGTLRSNLALSGSISDSLLLSVAKELGVDQIAATSPQGMDLEISEGGEGLSGGQRQLVALARVFLAQPKIWLLDEPTASLDSESETKVLEALDKQLNPNDILIIATHRPALAIKIATRVITMQAGSITQDGKPEEVLPQLATNFKKQNKAKVNTNNLKVNNFV